MFSFGAQPYSGMSNVETSEYVLSGNRLSKPDRCPEEAFELMLKCWEEKTKERPSMVEIHTMLRRMLNAKTLPEQPKINDGNDTTNNTSFYG